MNDETRHAGGLEDSAGRLVPDLNYPTSSAVMGVLEGTREPHELPHLLHDLWRDGFLAGSRKAQVRVDRANADADRLYDLAFNGEAARKRHEQMVREITAQRSRAATDERLRAGVVT